MIYQPQTKNIPKSFGCERTVRQLPPWQRWPRFRWLGCGQGAVRGGGARLSGRIRNLEFRENLNSWKSGNFIVVMNKGSIKPRTNSVPQNHPKTIGNIFWCFFQLFSGTGTFSGLWVVFGRSLMGFWWICSLNWTPVTTRFGIDLIFPEIQNYRIQNSRIFWCEADGKIPVCVGTRQFKNKCMAHHIRIDLSKIHAESPGTSWVINCTRSALSCFCNEQHFSMQNTLPKNRLVKCGTVWETTTSSNLKIAIFNPECVCQISVFLLLKIWKIYFIL